MGAVVLSLSRKAELVFNTKPHGLTARLRLKGNKEGPSAQALPCAAGHWGAVHAECPVQERLLPPGEGPQPGPMCSQGR